jgi:hypothetical protein
MARDSVTRLRQNRADHFDGNLALMGPICVGALAELSPVFLIQPVPPVTGSHPAE